MNKNLLLPAVAAFLAWSLFKVNNLINAGKRITISNPFVYMTRVNLKGKEITMFLDVTINNPSKERFKIQPVYVDAFSLDNQFLGRATPPQEAFHLYPESSYTLKGTMIRIPTAQINDIIFHGLRQQISLDIMLRVNGFEVKLTQLVTFNT